MQNKDIEHIQKRVCQPQNYVYLPFKKNECSEQILQQVHLCIKNAREDTIINKNYQFIAYGKGQLSQLPPLSRIYIIGYGLDLSLTEVEHSELSFLSGGAKAISIPVLMRRLIDDGLLTSDLLSIKLWFSNHNDNAEKMAEQFKICLDECKVNNKFFIDYYPDSKLCFPLMKQNEPHKWVFNVKTQETKRASDIRQSLFFNTESEKYGKNSVEDEVIPDSKVL